MSKLLRTSSIFFWRGIAERFPSRFIRIGRLLLGKLRRPCLLYFKRRATLEQAARKQGQCRQCADCCRLLFRCPFLSNDNLCLIYQSKVRPRACVHFPIDPRDIEEVLLSSGHGCGYWFDPFPSSTPKH